MSRAVDRFLGGNIETLIKTTFLIILVFAVINTVLNGIIYYSSKKELYFRVGSFWIALIVNFIFQANAQNGQEVIILAFAVSILPLNLLGYSSFFFIDKKYPWKFFSGLAAGCTGLTLVLLSSDFSFTTKSLPIAVAGASPLFYSTWLFLWKYKGQTTGLMKFYAVTVMLLGIHTFNFSFFRMNPENQLWGWPVAYGLYQLLAGILPAITLDFYHRKEQEILHAIINEKTKGLSQANDRLTLTLNQKNFLFRTLVHDISNPLFSLSVSLETKLYDRDKEKFVSTCGKMIDRMKALINQVKDFERTMTGGPSPALKPVELETSIDKAIELFAERLSRKSIQVEKIIPENLKKSSILVEERSFENSVLPNILSNAIKFSKSNSRLEFEVKQPSPQTCVVILRDFGKGIPGEMLKDIFEFESQTSRKGTEGEVGTGFGLPILRRILESYGGEILIHSREETSEEPGLTEVSLTLKLAPESSKAPGPTMAA